MSNLDEQKQEPECWRLYECVGIGWRLPIHVLKSYEDTFQVAVLDDFPYLKSQIAVIAALVEPFNSGAKLKAYWRVKATDLGRFAELSRFTDPEDVVVWQKPEAPIVADDFMQAYSQWDRAMIAKPEVAGVIWDSFCRFMQHWIINKQQPISLGFATLYALQARVNWKTVSHARYFGVVTGKNGHISTANTPTIELNEKLLRALAASSMTAYDARSKTVSWTLEIVANDAFKETCMALEEMKKHLKGATYLTMVEQQLKRQIQHAYDILRAYISETRKPMLLLPVDDSERGRRRYFHGDLNEKWKHRRIPSDYIAPAVSDRTSQRGGLADVASEAQILSVLPDLQRRCQNVRNAGKDVDEPADDAGGAGRVSVLDAGQGKSSGQLLFVQSDGRINGLEPGTEQLPV